MKIRNLIIITIVGFVFSSCKKNASDIVAMKNATFIIYTYDEYGMPSGSGSGFFIESNGIGLTNFHVLNGAAKALIMTPDSEKYEIEKIIFADEQKDIIKFQIKIDKKNKFDILTFSKNEPKQGNRVYCISNPGALENSFSEGVVSAIRKDKKHGKTIQFTAPISPGSSGAPVIDEDGKVIAIATFQRRDGQNLNFGVYLNDEILKTISTNDFSKQNVKFSKREKFVILNQKADNDPFSSLNAIEFGNEFTTLYFSYTRMNITPSVGQNWGFWLELNKLDEGFYLQNLETKEKYYITSSSVGQDKEHQTKVGLATTINYKVLIPKISSKLNKFSISERDDSRSSRWNNINLSDYSKLDSFDDEKYQINYAYASLSSNNYNDAKYGFLDIIDNNPENIEALNSLGVLAYSMENYSDAIYYLSKAIEINPSVEESYVNRHFVFLAQNDFKASLGDISKAISISPQQPEYYLYREKLYLNLNYKENAMSDFFKSNDIMAKDSNFEKLAEDLRNLSFYDYALSVRFKQ